MKESKKKERPAITSMGHRNELGFYGRGILGERTLGTGVYRGSHLLPQKEICVDFKKELFRLSSEGEKDVCDFNFWFKSIIDPFFKELRFLKKFCVGGFQ